MKLSARNQLKGIVKSINHGPVSTEVVVDVDGTQVVASITTDSAKNLDLKIGDNVIAVIKASSVMIGK